MRSIVDLVPITYRQFLDGYDPRSPGSFNLESVAARLTRPTGGTGNPAFDASVALTIYLLRVPNPRAAGPGAPDAFVYLRINYNGCECFNRHEASYLYDFDKLVYLVRRDVPPPPPRPRRGPPLPLPSPNRPPRRRSTPIPRIPQVPDRDEDF